MAESEGGGGGGAILAEIMEVFKEVFKTIWGFIPRAFMFTLWCLSACIILPCVFISGTLYPKWVEWGEKF